MEQNRNTEVEIKAVQPLLQQAPCCTLPFVQLWNEDCLETLKRLPTGSVDLMLQDPPYNTTECEWEYELNLPKMWAEWERIVKPDGLFIFFAAQPFTSKVVTSRLGFYKYNIYWLKDKAANFGVAKYRPLNIIEDIVIMGRGTGTYNPQMYDAGYKKNKGGKGNGVAGVYGKNGFKWNYNESTIQFPKNIIHFNTPKHNDADNGSLHPTQKPVSLLRYLIKTYSNEGDTVFDGYSGSGTTAAACIKEKRHFIGSELNKEYYDLSVKRLTEMSMQTELF